MTLKTQSIILAVAVILSFGFGRYSNRTAASTKIQSETDTQTKQDQVTDKRTVIVKEPGGKETTSITEETHVQTRENTDSQMKETVKASPQLQVSALAGLDLNAHAPTYGVAVSKQVLGPITVGAFGLTTGIVGVSIGMTF